MRTWLITAALVIGGVGPPVLLGLAVRPLFERLGPTTAALIVAFGGIALGGLWGRFCLGLIYRWWHGSWPGPLLRRALRELRRSYRDRDADA